MDYYNCELHSTDYVTLGETEWNLPRLIQPPPRKTLTSSYGNNAPYFPGYSRNIYPCRSKRYREFHSFQNNQYSKNEMIPRKSCPSYEWNFPMKNVPNHANRYNATMLLRGCSPYNLRSRFNSPYTQSSGDEFQQQKYPNELIFPKNPARMQNVMHWESEYPEMQNFGNFNAPQDLWDNNIVQTSSDQSCNRNIPLSRSLLQSSRPVGSVCEEVIHPQNKDKEILCITYPQQNLDSTEPVISSSSNDIQTVSVNDFLNTINLIENANSSLDNIPKNANSSLDNIHDQNATGNEVHLKTPENSLDFIDENALSVYFLNDFCLNSQTDDKIFDLASNNFNISSDNFAYNMLEETTVNSLERESFFDQIKDLELEITFTNKELGNVNETNLIENFDEKIVAEIGDTRFKESTNQVNEESSGYLTDNTHENSSGSKHTGDLHISTQSFKETNEHSNINYASLTENLIANTPTNVEDFLVKGDTDISGLKVSSSKALDSSHKNRFQRKQGKKCNLRVPTKIIKNKTKVIKNKRNSIKRELGSNWKNLNDKINKCTAEQRLIFHAPIININNQNQISTLFNDKKLSDKFNSKFYHKFGDDIIKLLCSIQNNASVGQSSAGKFSKEDICLSTEENFRLFPNESDNSQMNSEVLNPSLDSKESIFMYSNDLETLPNPIETSLSSVTNYILDEPMNTPIKHCDIAYESGSIEYSPLINENLEDNSESVREKREQKSVERKIYNNEIGLSSSLRSYQASENGIDSCMTLPENIFQPDSLDYSSTVQHRKITLKDNLNRTKNKRRKITWRKWNHITKRLLRTKLRSIGFLTKFHTSKIKSAKDRRNIKAVNQHSNNLYREAFSQTSESESNSLSGVDVAKQDAQTQWDISDIKESHESSEHEKNCYAETISGKDEILCNQEIIKCEKDGEFKSERNKYCWNLRPRKLTSAVINVNSSLKGIRSETNVRNARHNSLNLLENIRQNNNKKKSSEIENRSSSPKVDEVSEKQSKNSSYTNEKQNKNVQRYKRTTENLSQGNQRKFGKLKNNRMLADLSANQRVSSGASYAVKTAKTLKPKRNKKKN